LQWQDGEAVYLALLSGLFGSKFMHGWPDDWNTAWLGSCFVLKANALQPLGKLASQVI